MARLPAHQYDTIPAEAADQLHSAAEKLLYPDGSATLRPDAFGAFGVGVLPLKFKDEIEHLLGFPFEEISKEQLLSTVGVIACGDEKLFQELQGCMVRQGITVPFYSAYNAYHGYRRGPTRMKDINVNALSGGMDGSVAPIDMLERVDEISTVGRAVQRAVFERATANTASIEPSAYRYFGPDRGDCVMGRLEAITDSPDYVRTITEQGWSALPSITPRSIKPDAIAAEQPQPGDKQR